MSEAAAPFRQSGTGPAVVCIHSSASSSGQWKALMAATSSTFRILAVDLCGYGKSPPWAAETELRLSDETARIEPILAQENRFHLVGHSYGGLIALKIATDNPSRVASLTLYEPTAFFLLEPGTAARQEIEATRDDTNRLLDQGKDLLAGERFVDYWVGAGAWQATPEQTRIAIAAGMRKVRLEWSTGFGPSVSPRDIAALSMPILLLSGGQTTSAARGVVEQLRKLLPAAQSHEFAGLSHMGPVMNPQVVNPAIVSFVSAH